jgi:hypothetical protein
VKLAAVKYKGGACERCGYNKSPYALEFHHRDPSQKDGNISRMLSHSWSRVKKELDKCIMLCANCHREEHEVTDRALMVDVANYRGDQLDFELTAA